MRVSAVVGVVVLATACKVDTEIRAQEPPVLSDATFSTDEDTPVTVTLDGSDPSGDTVTYTVTSEPLHGDVVIDGDVLTYTPDPDYFGDDALTVLPTAARLDGEVATVSITVNPVNDAPTVEDGTGSVPEDSAGAVFTPVAVDVEGDALTLAILDAPSMGSVTVQGDGVLYVPDPDATGTDTFTFQASDGEAVSNVGTWTVSIEPVNDAPVAGDDAYSTVRNLELTVPASLGLLANDTDVDGDGVSLVDVSATTTMGGSVVYEPDGAFTYRIGPGALGTDTFTYTVGDGNGGEHTGTVSIEHTGSFRVVGAAGSTGPWVAPVHTTLGAAAQASHDGETLYILANTPADTTSVTLPASVSLLGEALPLVIDGQTLVSAGATPLVNNPIVVGADGTQVAGFDLSAAAPLDVTGRTDVAVSDITLTSTVGDCITATDAVDLAVTDVTMTGCVTGVEASNASAVLTRVDVTATDTGVNLGSGTVDLTVSDSLFTAPNYAIHLDAICGVVTVADTDFQGPVLLSTTGDATFGLSSSTLTPNHGNPLRLTPSGTGAVQATLTDLILPGDFSTGGLSLTVADSARLEAVVTGMQVPLSLGAGVSVSVGDTASAQVVVRDGTLGAAGDPINSVATEAGDLELIVDNMVLLEGFSSILSVSSWGTVSPRVGLRNTDSQPGFGLLSHGAPIVLGDTTPVGTAGVGTDGGAIQRTGNTSDGGAPSVLVRGEVVLTDLYGLPWFLAGG